MHYGQLLDINNDISKDVVYKSMTKYFNNPIMKKLKNIENYTMYISKIQCLLSTIRRYLIVIINKDNLSIGSELTLDKLLWCSLQTRTLEENHSIKPHVYNPSNMYPLTEIITIVNRDKEKSSYLCDELGLEITLLHKKGDIHEYANKGTVVTALETYSTIITFKI